MIIHGGSSDRMLPFAMATIQLQTPPPRWRRRFEQFRVASGLGEQSAAKQISTLQYCLGEEAESVLSSTNATEDEHIPQSWTNSTCSSRSAATLFLRGHGLIAETNETAEQYIMTLYTLAANCNYGGLETEMIRDRLVVEIRDTSLSERLQLDADLTLEKAKKAIRQREAVHEHQHILCGTGNPSLEAVHFNGSRRKNHDHWCDQQHCGNRRQKPTAKQCT